MLELVLFGINQNRVGVCLHYYYVVRYPVPGADVPRVTDLENGLRFHV